MDDGRINKGKLGVLFFKKYHKNCKIGGKIFETMQP